MPRWMKYAALLLVVVLAPAIWLCWFRGNDAWSGGAVEWGQGEMKTSERGYHLNRISSTIEAAQSLESRAASRTWGRATNSAFTCLVIDTGARQMWIESNGRVLPEYRTDLPASMEWKLHRSTPDGTTELPPTGL